MTCSQKEYGVKNGTGAMTRAKNEVFIGLFPGGGNEQFSVKVLSFLSIENKNTF